jgi:penicillin G amidase
MTMRAWKTAFIAGIAGLLACSDGDPDPAPDAGNGPGTDGGPGDLGSAGTDGGPNPDGGTNPSSFEIPGLDDPVTVRFDARGILHAECATPEDCMAVEGYFHAAHRFGQMDFRRRAAQGRLTELYRTIGFGSATISQDRQARAVFSTRTGEPMVDQLLDAASNETLGYLRAYTQGVNAWIDDLRNGRNGARVTEDWAAFEDLVEDWTVRDSASTVLLLINSLTNRASSEIAYGQAALALDTAQLADLLTQVPATQTAISPDASGTRSLQRDPKAKLDTLRQLEALQGRLSKAAFALSSASKALPHRDPKQAGVGSNSWVVSAAGSTDGKTLLANDPHLDLSLPAIWYLVNLDAGDFHVAGASFPGFPGILLGRNDNIAWGATTTNLDISDVYIEDVVVQNQQPVGVSFRGNTVPFTVRMETFANPDGGEDLTEPLLFVPHHGPVLELDAASRTALTLRWSAQDAQSDIDVLTNIWNSDSVAQFRSALEGSTTFGQNFVAIDRNDNIGWYPYNSVPSRPWASLAAAPWAPLPGNGDFEWGEPIPLEDLPQAENPARGWIVTANNDMTGALFDGDPTNDGAPYLQGSVAVGFRAQRAADLVREGFGSHTLESMQTVQSDVVSLMGLATKDAILAQLGAEPNLSPNGSQVRDLIQSWQGSCPTGLEDATPDPFTPSASEAERAEARGCAAFHVLWTRLLNGVFGDELSRAGYPRANAEQEALVRYLLAPQTFLGGSYWDDVRTGGVEETAADVVTRAFDDAGAALEEYLGSDPADWLWGRIHTVTLQIDDGRAFADGPFANDGGWYTVDVANPSNATFRPERVGLGDGFTSDFSHGAGASMRFACEADAATLDCVISLPGAQRGPVEGAESFDLMPRWLENDAFPLLFDAEEVSSAAVETILVNPG